MTLKKISGSLSLFSLVLFCTECYFPPTHVPYSFFICLTMFLSSPLSLYLFVFHTPHTFLQISLQSAEQIGGGLGLEGRRVLETSGRQEIAVAVEMDGWIHGRID